MTVIPFDAAERHRSEAMVVDSMLDEETPTMWRGQQWAVAAFGLECSDTSFRIKASDLRCALDGEYWPVHMARKPWVQEGDFLTAWLVALSLHGKTIAA